MSDPQRREFLAASAAMASLATLAGAQPAVAGDPSFMNNVPDPALAGKELPTFKFALEKSKGKVIGNSYGKEATVKQLPISKGIAGVSMRLEPGAMRELHWHATAAEWAFVIEGRVRTTVIDPQGYAETNDFDPGDVWYFPRGHGHMLRMPRRQALPLHPDLRQRLLLRVRHVQHHRLDRPHAQGAAGEEFRPARVGLRRLPEGRGLLRPRAAAAGGAVDAAAGLEAAAGDAQIPPAGAAAARDLSRAAASGGSIPRRFPISKTITGVILDLEPGALRELHWHPNADEWQYVIEGEVSVTLFGSHGRYRTEQLQKGDVGYIPQGYGHSIENVGDKPRRILIGFNAGIYETIDLSQWVAANPTTCSPPISASRQSCSRSSPIGMCSSRAGRALANSAPLAERRDADRLHSAVTGLLAARDRPRALVGRWKPLTELRRPARSSAGDRHQKHGPGRCQC